METSFTWVKRITEIGLTLMTPQAAKEKLDAVMEGSIIHVDRLTDLIDECATAAAVFVEKNDTRVSTTDAELITSLLGKIDGKDVVNNINPEELADWVKDLTATVKESDVVIA